MEINSETVRNRWMLNTERRQNDSAVLIKVVFSRNNVRENTDVSRGEIPLMETYFRFC